MPLISIDNDGDLEVNTDRIGDYLKGAVRKVGSIPLQKLQERSERKERQKKIDDYARKNAGLAKRIQPPGMSRADVQETAARLEKRRAIVKAAALRSRQHFTDIGSNGELSKKDSGNAGALGINLNEGRAAGDHLFIDDLDRVKPANSNGRERQRQRVRSR